MLVPHVLTAQFIVLIASMTNGYDGSMMNGLQWVQW